jgi:hypothetical protein
MQEHLDVPYHQQDTDSYCGAACAQMVLHTIGQPLLSMNNRQSAKHFTLDSTDSEDPISRTICWAIHHYQCAPIALVFGGNHWAVVRGYSASAAPAAAFDTSYSISSFDLNNPWPPVPAPPGPPPHTDGDVCGSGGNRGVADINVSYSTWQRDYLTPNVFGTQWLHQYVAICDPDPPGSPGPPPVPERERRFDGRPLLAAGLVREELLGKLKDAGLLSHPVWSKVFDDVRTAEPLLVERLDRPDSEYWIVPTVDERGRLRAAVGIDARFGDYQQTMAVRNPEASLFGFAEPENVIAHVIGRRLELPGNAGAVTMQQGLTVHPAFVWRPCRQSLSPFYPFRMILLGAHRIYVRVFDGAVFTALTNDKGGL